MSNACAMVNRCGALQRGAPVVIEGPVCRYCGSAAATEVAEGQPACWVCSNSLAVERLMTKYRRTE